MLFATDNEEELDKLEQDLRAHQSCLPEVPPLSDLTRVFLVHSGGIIDAHFGPDDLHLPKFQAGDFIVSLDVDGLKKRYNASAKGVMAALSDANHKPVALILGSQKSLDNSL